MTIPSEMQQQMMGTRTTKEEEGARGFKKYCTAKKIVKGGESRKGSNNH
jgi:hypothetical protein